MKTLNLLNELQSNYSFTNQNESNVYHNTKLLLSLYSKVLWRIEESLQMLDTECFESDKKHLYDLINNLIDVDTQIDKSRFERRMQSIEESKSLIEIIDCSLAMLKNYPDNGERLFDILRNSYSIRRKK